MLQISFIICVTAVARTHSDWKPNSVSILCIVRQVEPADSMKYRRLSLPTIGPSMIVERMSGNHKSELVTP